MVVMGAGVFLLVAGLSLAMAAEVDLSKAIIAKDGMAMVLVPAGEFWMGLPEGVGLDDEQPRHKVYLDAYYIDQYEATTERYAKFLEFAGWQKPLNWAMVKFPDHANRPVVGVTWSDADAYCQINGRRLPTEAEWEKAARGTTDRRFPRGGNTRHPTPDVCGQMRRFRYARLNPRGR